MSGEAKHARRPWLPWLALALIVIGAALLRLRFLDVPLERDEGEYAYAGQLLLQGVPPYAAAYNMKFPGTYAGYALVLAVLGESTRAVHVGLLLANAAAILLVFVLTRRLYGSLAGVSAAAVYALLSLGRSVFGMAAHATHFVLVPALLGILILADRGRSRRPPWLFASGVLLGLALLMKQHGFVFALFGLLVVLWRTAPAVQGRPFAWRRVLGAPAIVAAGVATPLAITAGLLLRAGVFDRFWFWTITYARSYVGERNPANALYHLLNALPEVVAPAWPLWLLAGAGFVAAWLDRTARPAARFVTGLFVCSFLGVLPGLWFRPHYFVLLLPATAILAGVAVAWVARSRFGASGRPRLGPAVALVVLGLGWSLVQQRELFARRTPAEVARDTYANSPFPEALEVARYIAANSEPGSRVAVLGSEPEIYFYAKRRSATGYLYTYALVERQPYAERMQREMIQEIEATRPEFLVFVHAPESWLAEPGSGKVILDWYRRYAEGYDLVGVAEILPTETVYRWEPDAAAYAVRSDHVIYVFRLPRR